MPDLLRRVGGLLLFLVLAAPLIVAAVRTVATRMPDAPRPVSVAGGAALAVAALQLLMTALGLVSLLRLWAVLVAIGLVGAVWVRHAPRTIAPHVDAMARGGGPWRTGAIAAIALVATQWGWWTGLALRQGVQRADSLTYHLPTALAFAHTGSVRTPVATTIGSPAAYYTDGMEVLHAMGMVLTRSDVLSCVSGFAFAALAVVACWAIGARYERGWLAALFACIVLAAPAIVQTQAGSALVDTPAAALALAAVAVALWSDLSTPSAVIPVALIAGAALAAKLLVLPVVVAALLIAIARTRSRRLAAAVALLAALESVPWLIRDWVTTGTPLPMAHLPGFTHFHFEQVTLLGQSAGTYLWHVLRFPHHWRGLADGLRSGFSILWLAFVLALLAALVSGARRARTLAPLLLLAVTAVVGYLASPFGAGGPGDPPFLFSVNLRYAMVMLFAAGMLLACRAQSASAIRWTGVAGWVVLAITVLPTTLFTGTLLTYRLDTWPSQHRSLGLLVAGLLVLVVIVTGGRLDTVRRLAPRSPIGIAVVAAVALVGLGIARSDVTSRFPATADLTAAYDYVDGLHHQRIAVVGLERTYPFAGEALSNQVTAIVTVTDGVPQLPASCAGLLAEVRSRRSTVVVIRNSSGVTYNSQRCLATDPNLQRVSSSGDISVWRYSSTPTPGAPTPKIGLP